jgi:6-pyruvoyl-tetrahydropterin synthase related domain
MLFLGNASGHDFQFHLASWLDVAGQWHEGIAFPRWAEWANWGFGEPRFIFYPPASWMLGAALGSILPWKMAPGAFLWLALVLAGISMWCFAREWLSRREAVMAAVLYAVNPYHLIIVYLRSDFAELLASALFPLVLWGALRLLRGAWRSFPLLALPLALVWLSNAPAAVLATYSLALVFVVAALLRRSARPLITGGLGMAAGFGLAAFYILPAAWEQRWVQIHQALADMLRPDQNFLFTHSGDPEFLFFNWKVSGVALGVILTVAIAAVFAARRRRQFQDAWWMLLALGAVATFLMFSPSLFLWRSLPKLEFVQFPWRWLGPLDCVLAFFLATAAGKAKRQWVCWLVIVAALGSLGTALVKDGWWDSEDIPVLAKAIQAGIGYEGTDEYQPLGCDRYELPGTSADGERIAKSATPPIQQFGSSSTDTASAVQTNFRVQRWTANRRGFSAQASAPATLGLRLLDYPGWQVQVDGENGRAAVAPDTAQMLVALPAGVHDVNVEFRSTWDRTAGASISLIFAIALLVVLLANRSSLRKF